VRSVEVDPRAIEVETAGLERQEGPGGAGDRRDRLGQAFEPIVEPGLVLVERVISKRLKRRTRSAGSYCT
jgi:hypothetical protein